MSLSRTTVLPSPYAAATRFRYQPMSMATRLGVDTWLFGLATVTHLFACVLLATEAFGVISGLGFGVLLVLHRARPRVLLTAENLTKVGATPRRTWLARLEHTIGHNNRRRQIISKQLRIYLKTWWPIAFISVEDELEQIAANGEVRGVAPGRAIVVSMSLSTLHLATAEISRLGRLEITDAVPLRTFSVNEVLLYNRDRLNAVCKRLTAWAADSSVPIVMLGLPTTINPGGRWFPDNAPRCVRTTLEVLAKEAVVPCCSTQGTRPPAGGVQTKGAMQPVVKALLEHLACALMDHQ